MTRLSGLQYPLLKTFIELRGNHYMSVEDAQEYDQRPFRSMLIQKWVDYTPGRGFHVTQTGKEAWKQFNTTNITRKNPTMPLTSYFDPTAYGLKVSWAKAKAKTKEATT